RTLPAGFIAPCLPTKTDKLPSGGLWLHEIKHDGFRIIARTREFGSTVVPCQICFGAKERDGLPVDTSSWSKPMRLPFGRRTAELETMNRILTDAARKRAEQIKELEHQVAQLEHQVAHLKTELESARKRATELEIVEAQRAHLLDEKDEELAGVREGLTQRAPPPPPSRSTEKSWPHFRPSAVDFCCSRLPIGAATERARALAMPAGTRRRRSISAVPDWR